MTFKPILAALLGVAMSLPVVMPSGAQAAEAMSEEDAGLKQATCSGIGCPDGNTQCADIVGEITGSVGNRIFKMGGTGTVTFYCREPGSGGN